MAEAAYRAGDMALADKVAGALKKDLDEQLAYYAYLGDMSVQELHQAVQDIMRIKPITSAIGRKISLLNMRQAYALTGIPEKHGAVSIKMHIRPFLKTGVIKNTRHQINKCQAATSVSGFPGHQPGSPLTFFRDPSLNIFIVFGAILSNCITHSLHLTGSTACILNFKSNDNHERISIQLIRSQ